MKFKKKLAYFLLATILTISLLLILTPVLLQSLGLHPDYDGEKFNLATKKVLIVTTSHGTLNKPGEVTGPPTGVFGSEMTVPYYEFLDANMQVDIGSIRGGEIPIDPLSFTYFIKTKADKRYLRDPTFQTKVQNSIPIREIDFKHYDVVFFAGGWGAAYDFAQSKILAEKVSEAYYNSDVIYGSLCHGALAFTEAKDTVGEYLVKDRIMTGVTMKQLEELHISYTPLHPEKELKKAGAIFQAKHKHHDYFATLTVMDQEKRFVTGQNQNAGHETAQLIMKVVSEQP